MVIFMTESPIAVILSGSMEPGFKRGDLMFLHLVNGVNDFETGDIIVYTLPGKQIPIIHRLIEFRIDDEGRIVLLTKGDNNPVDDRGLYDGPLFLEPEQIMGKAYFHIPYLGMATIMLTDYPLLKWLMIGSLLLSTLLNKDQ